MSGSALDPELLAAAFEFATEAIILIDDDRRCIAANAASEILIGRPRDEILAGRIEDFVSPRVQRFLRDDWASFLADGTRSGSTEVARPDGTIRFVEFTGRARIHGGVHVALMRDVTEGVELERTLTRRLEVALRESRTVLFALGPDLGLRWSSTAIGAVPAHLAAGRTLTDLLGARGGQVVADFARMALEDGAVRHVGLELELDGMRRHFDATFTPSVVAINQIGGVDVSLTDLTDLRVAERRAADVRDRLEERVTERTVELAASSRRYRELVEGLDGMVWEVLPDGRGWASARALAVTGWPPEVFEDPDGWRDLVDEPEPRRTEVINALAGDEPVDIEYRVRRQDGAVAWIRGRTRVVKDEDGGNRKFGIALDVSERHRAEERYQALVEATGLVVYTEDLVTGEIYVSQQAERLFGHEPERLAVPGFLRSLVLAEDREMVCGAWDAVPAPGAYDLEYRVQRSDGRTIWVNERMSSIRDAADCVVRRYGHFTDVTERRRLEETLAQGRRMEAVGRLATAAAHDFGNVLLGIRIFQEYLASSIPIDDPRHDDVLLIGEALERGQHLTHQLLAFGREPRSGAPLAVEAAGAMLELQPMLARVSGHGIHLVVDTSGEHRALIPRGELEQAVLNLVINAHDAMPAGGDLTIRVTTEKVVQPLSGLEPGVYVVVGVTDTGSGMTPDVAERAMEPFFTTKPGGTGIGLSSVYGSLREAGGTVRLTTTPGGGTTVELLVPAAPAPRRVRTMAPPHVG